jgi:hypothetical protein|tara:strand:- start:494 stop:934 length:441 start_codon:yes stop_codon:yes gene_type:complete
MKKIKISENELVSLIEKLVKENLSSGNGHSFGMLGTPTSKYKDLYEDDDIEGEEDVDEETLDVNVDDETQDGLNQEDAMENIKEAKLVSRLKRKVYTKKPNKTISEQRSVTKWTREEIDNVTDMVTELYNDMVKKRDVAPPEGPQG